MSDTNTNPTRNLLAVFYHELRTPATVIQKSIVQRVSLQQ